MEKFASFFLGGGHVLPAFPAIIDAATGGENRADEDRVLRHVSNDFSPATLLLRGLGKRKEREREY